MPTQSRSFLCCVLFLFLLPWNAYGLTPFSQLKGIDLPTPQCDGARDMDVSHDYFVEIANALPGRDEYNALIQLKGRKDWSSFEMQADIFRRAFESSPLMEAVMFLSLQAKMDEMESSIPEKIKEIEKDLRQVLLLYPKSILVPIITVDAAAFNIRMGSFQKALSLLESVKHDYPFHGLSCHIQAGIGESAFLLHEFRTAKNAFEQVLAKCSDRPSRLHAEVRLADLRMEKEPQHSLKVYEEHASRSPILLGRVAPWAYFNAGEVKYQQSQYPSAKFYYNEFLRYGSKDFLCMPWALKRVADISQRTNLPLNIVVGNYLALNDRSPLSDVGRYGKLHAHLLELDKVSEAESERRMKIFDESVDKIHSDQIRTLLFLEKGLALLSAGEKVAIPYLLRLSEKKEDILKKPDVMSYIRTHILKILKNESGKFSEKKISKEEKKDKLLLEPLEEAYSSWLKGTPQEKEAQILYRTLLVNRFDELLEAENTTKALGKLDRWAKSGLWPKNGDPKAIEDIATILLRFLHDCPDADRKELARSILDKKEIVEPFVHESTKAVWVALYLADNNLQKVKEYLGNYNARNLASIGATSDKEVRSLFSLALGKGSRAVKRFADAENYFDKVNDPDLLIEAQRELIEVYRETGKIDKQLNAVIKLLPKFPKEELPSILKSVEKTMAQRKQWSQADALFKAGEKAKFSKMELAPFYLLVARASYETGKWKEAIDRYETAITINQVYEKNPEVKFQLGKSYLKVKDKGKARKLWEDVVAMKDSFWSSIAQNELQLLEPK